MTRGDDDEYDVSPQHSSDETNWGLVLMIVLVAVVGCAIFWDYGNTPQSQKTQTETAASE